MGTHLGYLGNTAVYDARMRERAAIEDADLRHGGHNTTGKAIAGTGLTGEQRYQRKKASLGKHVASECAVLVPYRSEHNRDSWLLMDGVMAVASDGVAELVAFNERGNGIHLIHDSELPNVSHPGNLLEYDGQPFRQHDCHALGCGRNVPPKMFMCGKHWSMVPKDLQKLVWQHYQKGQELGEAVPTKAYLDVTARAIREVAHLEELAAKAKAEREEEFQMRKRERENRRLKRKGGDATKRLL